MTIVLNIIFKNKSICWFEVTQLISFIKSDLKPQFFISQR